MFLLIAVVAEWYTRWSQKPLGFNPVWVRLPPTAPAFLEINFRFLNFKVRVNIVLVGGECRSKRSERDGVASFTDCLSVSSIQDVKTRGRLPPTAPAFLEINF